MLVTFGASGRRSPYVLLISLPPSERPATLDAISAPWGSFTAVRFVLRAVCDVNHPSNSVSAIARLRTRRKLFWLIGPPPARLLRNSNPSPYRFRRSRRIVTAKSGRGIVRSVASLLVLPSRYPMPAAYSILHSTETVGSSPSRSSRAPLIARTSQMRREVARSSASSRSSCALLDFGPGLSRSRCSVMAARSRPSSSSVIARAALYRNRQLKVVEDQ
jgi:hypothetical protein